MAVQKSKGKGGQRKHGRDSRRPTHQRYDSHNQRDKNKRKHILRSNGEKALAAWNAGNVSRFPRVKRGPIALHHLKSEG